MSGDTLRAINCECEGRRWRKGNKETTKKKKVGYPEERIKGKWRRRAKWEGQKITGWKSEREPDKQQKMRGGNLRRTARRAALVSTSPALQAGGGEPVERSETIKKRWIAIFPSTQGLLREEQKESERGGGGGGKEKPAYFSGWSSGLRATKTKPSRSWPGNSALNFLLWRTLWAHL